MVLQTPWLERSFHFDFPVGMFPIIFNRLEGTIFRLNAMLTNAGEDLCANTREGWSVKEHVGHLYDLEDLWWKRLNDFVERKPVLTPADLNNTRTKEAGHNDKPISLLLEQFTLERQKTLEGCYGFDEETLRITSVHPRLQQPMRLIDSLSFVAEHDDHHLAKIAGLLRKG
jgi:uncharacterized damage-inducible protein DinB